MNKHLIKLRFGLTIDENRPVDESCPRCGSVCCYVKEEANHAFCLNTFCDFHDYTTDIVEVRKERFLRFARYGTVFFYRNDQYECNIPFMIEDDIRAKKYIIREFELDKEKYNLYISEFGENEYSWQSCYKQNCISIAQYYSIQLMCEDGWLVNKDPINPFD